MKTASTQFNLFDEDPGYRQIPRPGPVKRKTAASSSSSSSSQDIWDEEGAARQLEATGRYRILRKLVPRPVIPRDESSFPCLGVLVDTETTGLHHARDEIIESGGVVFTHDNDGMIGDVVGVYSGLRQPSMPIPPEITRLTASRTTWSPARTSILPLSTC